MSRVKINLQLAVRDGKVLDEPMNWFPRAIPSIVRYYPTFLIF